MEKQIVNIKITTKGEVCVMTDEEIKKWYAEKVASLFNEEYGTPEIEVELKREEC